MIGFRKRGAEQQRCSATTVFVVLSPFASQMKEYGIEDAATKENASTKMIRRFRPVGSAPASGATLSEGHYSHSGSLLVLFQRA